MSPTIHYDTGGEVTAIRRDEYHINDDGFVVAFDNPTDQSGTYQKVKIPKERVIRIND